MIRQLVIENFKSILKETIPLARFTVIIGENGAGKSNILEALVMVSAASSGKLERELLIGRGIRITSPELMISAFNASLKNHLIKFSVSYDYGNSACQQELSFSMTHDGELYSDWKVANAEQNPLRQQLLDLSAINILLQSTDMERFTVYAPEYYTLRNFVTEGQIAPLGTRGEGLLKLLSSMYEKENERFQDVNDGLKILGWYEGIDGESLAKNSAENRIQVRDKFIKKRGVLLDQISINEGFLFCLFYLTLFASSSTPSAFAIENIENGLNPKLSEALVKKLKKLGVKYSKQAIVTSHSPSVLDALNLDGQDDILLAAERNLDGHTRVMKITKPRNTSEKTSRLSELFLKGHIGGMPKNFL